MLTSPPIELANLGMADSLILMVLALVVFGPRRLPQIGRQIGKLMYEFRKASNDFKFQMEEELRVSEDADRKKKEEATRAALPAPTQTIDAGSNTALIEQVSVSAQLSAGNPTDVGHLSEAGQPSPYPGEVAYPPQFPPEDVGPAQVSESQSSVTLPRTVPVIQPPSVGQQVPATRPHAAVSNAAGSETVPRVDETLEANLGAPTPTPGAPPEDYPQSETVSQHG